MLRGRSGDRRLRLERHPLPDVDLVALPQIPLGGPWMSKMAAAPDPEKRLPSLGDGEAERDRIAEPRRGSGVLRLVLVLALILVVLPRAGVVCWRRAAAVWPPGGGGENTGTPVARRDDASAAADAARPKAAALECFQVAQPVLTPAGPATSDGVVGVGAGSSPAKPCSVLLMNHSFGNSYNQPFVGNYVPPSCAFNRVVMNFTVVSAGRQFDRLALMYMNDTEVWRTSTAEPRGPPGIRWVYEKDMTEYMYFWKAPQKIIFDLGNLINDKYTGPFNTTLTATFFKTDVNTDQAPPSDLIIPISARKSGTNAVSQFTLPADNATNTISFPRNANRAVFSVSANGQADEEFWWSNVLQSDSLAFNQTAGQFPGFSPFREVQVYIDGKLAGVQWPFPVIFTGGVVPGLHRPIAGIDVFDLREHEIDITPWLPVLCDGGQHTFTILVAGLDDDGKTTATLTQTVGSSWYVTGKIFVWLDKDGAITTGAAPTVSGLVPTIRVSQRLGTNSTGANETLDYTAEVRRAITVTGKVVSQGGASTVSWSQTLSYVNTGNVSGFGVQQVNDFNIQGSDKSAGGAYSYGAQYQYPLFCNTTTDQTAAGNLTLWAQIHQGLELQVSGSSVFPTGLEAFPARHGFTGGSLLRTTVDGTATFTQSADGKNSSSWGTTNQIFHFGGISGAGMLGASPDVELYFRNVTAANDTLVSNREIVEGHPGAAADFSGVVPAPAVALFAQAPTVGAGTGPRVFLGRGGADPAVAAEGVQLATGEVVANQTPMRS